MVTKKMYKQISSVHGSSVLTVINTTFLNLKIIVDKLIDVGNAKHQNITS